MDNYIDEGCKSERHRPAGTGILEGRIQEDEDSLDVKESASTIRGID